MGRRPDLVGDCVPDLVTTMPIPLFLLRAARWSAAALVAASLLSCRAHGDPDAPIPTSTFPAPQVATRLVVVLPGRADDLADLRESGIVPAIQRAWPDADVVLAELTLDYYMAGRAIPRLHEQLIAPARERGYESIWLVGASLGGMGSLLYDRQHPNGVDGMVLLAPYLGDGSIQQEISAAGGLAQWTPGPERPIAADTWQRELWRRIQQFSQRPSGRPEVWLAYGDDDRFRRSMPLLARTLPPAQVRVHDGGHTWKVWTPATREILLAVDARRKDR